LTPGPRGVSIRSYPWHSAARVFTFEAHDWWWA
jgi:hypothetical protein